MTRFCGDRSCVHIKDWALSLCILITRDVMIESALAYIIVVMPESTCHVTSHSKTHPGRCTWACLVGFYKDKAVLTGELWIEDDIQSSSGGKQGRDWFFEYTKGRARIPSKLVGNCASSLYTGTLFAVADFRKLWWTGEFMSSIDGMSCSGLPQITWLWIPPYRSIPINARSRVTNKIMARRPQMQERFCVVAAMLTKREETVPVVSSCVINSRSRREIRNQIKWGGLASYRFL